MIQGTETAEAGTISGEELMADGAESIRDACSFLGMGRAWIYEQMAAGRLPFVKLGRRRLIPRRALARFAAARMSGGDA